MHWLDITLSSSFYEVSENTVRCFKYWQIIWKSLWSLRVEDVSESQNFVKVITSSVLNEIREEPWYS